MNMRHFQTFEEFANSLSESVRQLKDFDPIIKIIDEEGKTTHVTIEFSRTPPEKTIELLNSAGAYSKTLTGTEWENLTWHAPLDSKNAGIILPVLAKMNAVLIGKGWVDTPENRERLSAPRMQAQKVIKAARERAQLLKWKGPLAVTISQDRGIEILD